MLTQEQAISKIKKVYKTDYEKYDEMVEWLVDEEGSTYYAWRFSLPHTNVRIRCCKITGAITIE